MTPMNDEQLDQAISRYLGWRSQQLQGAPDAQGMAWRVADTRWTPRPRWQWSVAMLATIGLLLVIAAGALLVAGAPQPAPGPLVNGPLVVANALGWRGTDGTSGAAIQLEPCDGLCEEAMDLRLSADGRTVFFVDPTPDGGDLVSDRPGWAIWRWDRLDESVRRVVGCGEVDCQLRKPVPSPDGRYLAYAQGDGIVVVDAGNGQEVYRLPDLVADGWSLPFANVAWDADGRLLVLDLDIDGFSYRTVDVSTGTGAEFTLPRDGLLESSPDGATTLLMTGEPDVWRLWILDDQLEHTRVLWEGAPWVSGVTWSPDGTTIAGQTMAEVPPPRSVAYDLQIVDIATGTLTTHADDDAVAGQPLWLPAE